MTTTHTPQQMSDMHAIAEQWRKKKISTEEYHFQMQAFYTS
jgi:hypothetical protein